MLAARGLRTMPASAFRMEHRASGSGLRDQGFGARGLANSDGHSQWLSSGVVSNPRQRT